MKNIKLKIFLLSTILGFSPFLAFGHCPLSTVGSGALALLAKELGVKTEV